MHIAQGIHTNRCNREFMGQALPDKVVTAILDAGRRAWSGANKQAWHLIAIHDRGKLQALAQLGAWAGHLADAALGVVIVTIPDITGWNTFDAGQAATEMQLAAWERGVGSCITKIFEPIQVHMLVGIPANLEVDSAMSFGYPTVGTPRSRLRRSSV